MKLTRRGTGLFRDLCSKLLLLVATVLVCLWMVSGARAAVQVADVKAVPGEHETVRITFSQKITSDQVTAEFQRNFLQLSLNGVSAVPAKNSSIAGGSIDKVFIYQYQPDITRARIIFKRDVESMKHNIQWTIKDNAIEINMPRGTAKPVIHTDKIKTVATATSKLPIEAKKPATPASPAASEPAPSADDAELIKQLLNDDKKQEAAAPSEPKTEETLFGKPAAKGEIKEKRSESPVRKMFTGLMIVLTLMAGIAYGFKRFVLKGKTGVGRGGEMIEMVSSYMISPKKSIAVVRVGQQMMVLGITDDNINLIQNLGPEAGLDKYLDDNASGGGSGPSFDSVFSKRLAATAHTSSNDSTPEEKAPPMKQSIRALIRQRVEGFKPL